MRANRDTARRAVTAALRVPNPCQSVLKRNTPLTSENAIFGNTSERCDLYVPPVLTLWRGGVKPAPMGSRRRAAHRNGTLARHRPRRPLGSLLLSLC
jgi:hypothetical protein